MVPVFERETLTVTPTQSLTLSYFTLQTCRAASPLSDVNVVKRQWAGDRGSRRDTTLTASITSRLITALKVKIPLTRALINQIRVILPFILAHAS